MRLYLCILENTLNNNIHRNQIIPLVEGGQGFALFLAPMFIFGRNGFSLNSMKYADDNVFHIRIPFLSYNFLLNIVLLPFLLFCVVPMIGFYVYKYKIGVIHARNHVSALCALAYKKIFRKVRVIADFRGHYPEEGAILGRWSVGSLNFKAWKKLESYICLNVDTLVVISKRMRVYFSEKYNIQNVVYIPALVDTKRFHYSDELRLDFRKKEGIETDEIVYLYVGSLGQWHDLDLFFEEIDNDLLSHKIGKYRVYILSSIDSLDYSELFFERNVKVLTVPANIVNSYLCGSDVGVLPGTRKIGPEYDLLYKTMISSKVEEYLCTGLRVLVNDRIEGVKEIISEAELVDDRGAGAEYYQCMFSVSVVKSKYSQLYGDLVD